MGLRGRACRDVSKTLTNYSILNDQNRRDVKNVGDNLKFLKR